MTHVLIATTKPFATEAKNNMISIIEQAGFTPHLLESYTSQDDLKKEIANVDAVIIRSDIIDKEIIDAAQNLKIIVRAGAGYDNVDIDAAREKNIVVMNTPGQNANAVAELVFGLLVFFIRGQFTGLAGSELKGKNIGIQAFGNIGKIVAKIAQGFGMKVYAFDPYVSHEKIENEGVVSLETVEELYETCQYVSLHIPATPKTKESINYALLSRMPKNAVLINTARKEVIHEDGVLRLMKERTDFSYISDIAPSQKDAFEADYAGRFFFTPKKLGAQTAEANTNAGIAAANQIIDYITNENTTFQVNK
ncbi:MAG: NAD(P)-dependent oxidoreductase [Bacteroidales bacterium]|nr:NAD(P)-dependent oxidoreductase [Bacteroidales bacterium]